MRYVESLIWDTQFSITLCGFRKLGKTMTLAEKYALPYIDFDSLQMEQVNQYDCVIVAVPAAVKRVFVQRMEEDYGYHNIMILEKPLALSEEDLNFYARGIQQNRRYAVVCQRDFFPKEYHIYLSESYRVVFPSYEEEEFNIVHMLPHVLSWLLTEDDSLEQLERAGKNTYRGIWRGSCLTIEFVKRTVSTKTCINNQSYPDMQYRKANAEIVKRVLHYDADQFKKSVDIAIKVSKMIMKIMEDMEQ